MNTKTQVMPLKGVIAALCALALALALVPVTALSAHADNPASGASNECTWTIDGAGTLTIAPSNGSSGTLANLEYHTDNSAPWLAHRSAIKAVVIKPGVKANENLSGMFADCAFITSIDLAGLDTTRTTNMESMFLGCTRLASIDATRLSTANVEDMTMMFKGCSALTSLDVSGFNTSKVAKMQAMFESCTELSTLNVSGFDTSKVEVMTGMFASCPRLSSLDVSRFDTSRVTHMDSMFSGCASLGSLNVSNFDTSRVAVMGNMFSGCSSIGSLDVSKFDTSDVISMEGMFYGCKALRSLDLSSFDTSKVTRMELGPYKMFGGCDDLAEVKLGTGFSFKGARNEVLTTLPEGEWHSQALDKTFTAAQIAADRNNAADSYSRYIPDDPEKPRPTEPQGERITMFRLYNPNSGEHFYTSSEVERDNCVVNGWNDEGIGWIAPSEGQPVYRVYNPNAGEHHYTMSTVERDSLVAIGWVDEGERWRSNATKHVVLYRLYNPNEFANNHHYTKDAGERDILVSKGWKYEGESWYGTEYYADIEMKDLGTITVSLDATAAPKTVDNFVKLANKGFYNGLGFHRIIKDFMMQGGDPLGTGSGGSGENIYGEFADNGFDNPVSHTRGAISMARSTDPNSGSSQFFICHKDVTDLDGHYAAFGHVIDGIEIVDKICDEIGKPGDDPGNGMIDRDKRPVIEKITTGLL